MKVCGIDPGVRGGAAIVELVDGGTPQLVDVTDIPVIGVKAEEWIDALALRAWIMTHQPQHVYVERGSMPRQGVSSTFKYARAVGSIEATVACCEIPMTVVEIHGLRGVDKAASRQRALQLFPAARAFFYGRKDHGRAEASLIALMGAKGPSND